MVRAVGLIALFSLFLSAGALEQSVRKIVGERTFAKNRLIITTVFAHKDRFYREGRLDLVKIVRVLRRLGLIKERFSQPTPQEVLFSSFDRSPLFLRLAMEGIEQGGILGAVISKAQVDEEGAALAFGVVSQEAIDIAGIGAYLQRHGVKVLGLDRQGERWHLFCESSQAFLTQAKEPETLSEPIWLNVFGKKKITITSHSKNHWYPQVAIYDRKLRPLELIEKSQKTDSLEIALPKGSYYIKIADKFSIKNIRYGLGIAF